MGRRTNKDKNNQQATGQSKAPDAVPDVPLPAAAGDSFPAAPPLATNKSEAGVKSAAGLPAKAPRAGDAADSSQPSDVTKAPAAPVEAPAAPSTPTGTSTSTTPELGSSSTNVPMPSSSPAIASANASEPASDVADAVIAAASSVMKALDASGTNQAVMEDAVAASSQGVSGTTGLSTNITSTSDATTNTTSNSSIAVKPTHNASELPLVETQRPAVQPAVQPAAAGPDLAAAATPAPEDNLQEDKNSEQQQHLEQQQAAPAQPSPLLAARSSSINKLSIAGGSLFAPPTADGATAAAEATGPFGSTSTTTPVAAVGVVGAADGGVAPGSSTSPGSGGVLPSGRATGPDEDSINPDRPDVLHLLRALRAGDPMPALNSSSSDADGAADGGSTSTPAAAEVAQAEAPGTQPMVPEAAVSPAPAPVPAFSDGLVISKYPGSPAVVHTSSSMSTAAAPPGAAGAGVSARNNLSTVFPQPSGVTALSNLLPKPAAAPTSALGAPDSTLVTTYMSQTLPHSEAAATTAATAASSSSSSLKPFPTQLLPTVGTSPELTNKHMHALSVWYTKFCADSEGQQVAAITQHCVPGMAFEDNFIKVWDPSMVAVQFAALKRVTGAVQLLPEKIEVLPAPPGAPNYTLRIVSRIAFKMWDWKRHLLLCMVFPALLLLPATLESWVTDEVTVRSADNQIVSYKQRVHNIPTAPTFLRAIFGLITTWLFMMLLGW